MSNHNKGEIKTWNEGKPNVVGSSGALGLIGGIAGRAVKLFSNLPKQYLRNNTTMLNIRSAVKQSLGKGKKITTPGTRKNLTNLSRDAVLDAKGMLKAKTSLKVQQSAGKGGAKAQQSYPSKVRLADQYHTVDRGAIKKFNRRGR